MAFDLNNFDKLSQAGLTQMMKLYGYVSTADNLATIAAANYFNEIAHSLAIGDYIYLRGSDGSNLYGVTAVVPNVTLSVNPDLVAPDSIVNADINSAAAIAYSKLAALPSTNILVGSAGNVATAVAMSGDATLSNAGALTIGADKITTAKILNANVTTAKIADANVTLAKLAAGITPSHVVKYAGSTANGGGSATIVLTVTGVAATDICFAQLSSSTNLVNVLKVTPTLNTITVLLSADPGAATNVSYQALRAAA